MPKLFRTATASSRGGILLGGAAALFLLGAALAVAFFLLRAREEERREAVRRALLRETAEIAAREEAGRRRLRRQFRRELPERCSPHFDAARRGAAEAAKELGSFSACVTLGSAAIRDRANGTRNFEEAYLALLDKPVIRPCLLAERAARETLGEYVLRLCENRLEFTVALAAACGGTPGVPPREEVSPELRSMLDSLANRTLSLHAAKASAAFGVVLEVAFLRSGCRSAARLFAAAAAKFGGSAAAAGICAAADGPLPIGDLIGGVLTIAGGAWTAYDLYKASCVLPRQFADELNAGIGELETRLVADFEARAEELDREFRREAGTIIGEVRRALGAGTGEQRPRRRMP